MTQTAKVFSGSKEGKVKYPYDAMVYIDGTNVIAINKEGNTIKRGVAGTDDTTVIQAAINGYGTTYISSGAYYINCPILLVSNKTVFGDGWETKLYTTATFVGMPGSCNAIFRNTTVDGNVVIDINITIRDLYLNCNATKSIGTDASGIFMRGVGNVLIDCVYAEHCKYFGVFISTTNTGGVATGRSYNCTISNCYVNDTEYDCIAYTSDYGKLINNYATKSGAYGCCLEESDHCIVSGNICYDNYGGVRSTNFSHGYSNYNTICNNVVHTVTEHGIFLSGSFSVVDGNTVYSGGAVGADNSGISIYGSNRSVVSNNTISGTKFLYGIRDSGSYNLVSGNYVVGVQRGISPCGSSGSAYISNVARNCSVHGIAFYSSPTNILVANNVVTNDEGATHGAIYGYNQGGRIYICNNYVPDSSHTYSGFFELMPDVVLVNNIFGFGTSGRSVFESSENTVSNNIGYVSISETRCSLDNILEKLGSPRLLCPCAQNSGTSISDYTRNNNTLTAQASVATWHSSKGRATYYNFNGSSHYLYRTNDTDFDFGNSVTDSAFSLVVAVNPDNITSRQIIGKWDVNNLREWRLFFDASGYPTLQLYDESVDKYIGRQYQTAFTTGSWKILVTTYDGSGICAGCKIYIDGVQLDDADYTDAGYVAMEAVSANLTIGALKNAAAYSEYYDGKMTWIGIAAKELSPDEVWSLTQRLKGVLGI